MTRSTLALKSKELRHSRKLFKTMRNRPVS